MRIIVMDLEMNQPSNKIIDIGAVFVDLKQKKIVSIFDELCNPGELPSDFLMRNGMTVTELTGISPEMVSAARSLKEVLIDFWAFVEKCNCGAFVTAWGRDVSEIIEQSNELSVAMPRVNEFDLKKFTSFFRSAKGIKGKGGLHNAIEAFGLTFQGKAHRGLADSENTAFLMMKLFNQLETFFEMEKVMAGKGSKSK